MLTVLQSGRERNDFSMLFIKIQINTMGASWSYYMYTHNKFRNIFDKETYAFFIID